MRTNEKRPHRAFFYFSVPLSAFPHSLTRRR
jgi:hypothetical protein